MSVYRLFERGDLLASVVHTQNRVLLASGSTSSVGFLGWRGSTGTSSSLSLYGGVRGRYDVKQSDFSTSGISVYPIDPLDTHSIDKVVYVSGSYPSTGSVRLVNVRRVAQSDMTQVTADDWWDEHFSPVNGLFDHYVRYNSDYFTGSYDFYCLYLKQQAAYTASCVYYSGSSLNSLTSSYTVEARVKPLSVTGSAQDFTIVSQRRRFKLYITGSDGRLAFTDFGTVVTSSVSLTKGVWQHVAVSVGTNSASLYVDAQQVANVLFTGSLVSYAGNIAVTSSFLCVGAEQVMGANGTIIPSPDRGYHGFIYETRVWDVAKTQAQLSSSAFSSLFDSVSGSENLRHYSRFNDGPMSSRHGLTQGSGTYEYGRGGVHGTFVNVNNAGTSPVWHPNDDVEFFTRKVAITDTLDTLKVFHVPSMFYGRQIATGSVVITCNAYNRQGITRVLKDDGRGGLYISGSITRTDGLEDYRGVRWNKVGNVFYSEGLIVITDPSMWDLANQNKDWTGSTDLLQVSFDGTYRVPTKTFFCRMETGDFNFSNNPSYSILDDRGTVSTDDDVHVAVRDDGTTYTTAIGLYNEERKLVAVAKIAQPIRKRTKDKNTIKLRLDF